MDFILDTNILISAALLQESIPSLCLQKSISSGNILFSKATFAELKNTLNKPKLKKYITSKDKFVFINKLEEKVKFIEVTHEIDECRDPKDNIYLELALSGSADCIITGDNDLLVLNPFRNIPIITPKEFLNNF